MGCQHLSIERNIQARSRHGLDGLARSISEARIRLFCLILASLFLGSCYATSSCSSSIITCTCANGQIETFSPNDNDKFLEARNDPKSCCYYKPSSSPTTGSIAAYNPIYAFGVKPVMPSVASPSASGQEIPYEVVVEPTAIPYEAEIPYEIMAEPVKEKPNVLTLDGLLAILRILARNVFITI